MSSGRSYLYNVANSLDLASFGNGLDADGVKLYCGKVGTSPPASSLPS